MITRSIWVKAFIFFHSVFSIALEGKSQQRLAFNHFTEENGLSSGSILSIAQDQKGFMWVGTMDGLNRYDGKRVKIYRTFYKDNPIGPSLKISSLLVDKNNNVWIGTSNGLYLYHHRADSFSVFFHSASDASSISHNYINTLFMDSGGNIWVGTLGGLDRIMPRQSSFSFLSISIDVAKKNFSKNVLAVFETSKKKMMVGTDNGLVLFTLPRNNERASDFEFAFPDTAIVSITEDISHQFWLGSASSGLFTIDQGLKVIRHYQQGSKEKGLLSNVVRKVCKDREGRIWVGTLKGINLFYPGTGMVDAYTHDPSNSRSLNYNSVYDIHEDRQGNIWIGTFFGGLNYVESVTTPFEIYQNQNSPTSISSNIISSIIGDKNNNLWIGTEAEGLNYFDRQKGIFKRFNSDESNKRTISSNLVKTVLQDQYKDIWVGMHRGGVNVIDKNGNKKKEFAVDKGDLSLNSNNVISMVRDDKENIWIGTEDSGVNIYNSIIKKTQRFEEFCKGKTLTNNAVTCLFQDSQKNIWIGTMQGLNKVLSGGHDVVKFERKDYPGQLLSHHINCITEDRNHHIWIGTYNGLLHYDPVRKGFTTYTENDGLASNKVVGIQSDEQNNLWVSTNKGLSLFNAARTHFNTFTVYDGLPGNVFNYNSFFRDQKGLIFFGGDNGLIEFDPKEIALNKTVPSVVLTGLVINGHAINTRDSSGILSTNISETSIIILEHNQNVVSVEYAVMNFIKSAKNRSAYMLSGYDKNWIYTNEHIASFTNLPPGTYKLLIKASNNDDLWNQPQTFLEIKILPPIWKTWWAYLLYILFGCLLVFAIIYFFASRAALRRKLRYEHLVNVKQQELHQMKMDFFTHISHEIRTPLTLITGPVEVLSHSTPTGSSSHKLLNTIKVNAERLLKLTTDLLEFRKADSGHTQLKIVPSNLDDFTRSVVEKFEDAAAKKSIDFSFECTAPEIIVYFDPHHLEIILSNLLSNAIKFTPEGGRIAVKIEKQDPGHVRVLVCDNGIGIPPESQKRIFTNFYQAQAGGTKNTGTGIGLAFSKSLMELHKGNLDFRSAFNTETGEKETCFIATLRLGKDHFNEPPVIQD